MTGGNGTGKTTLLRSIAGLQPIDEGEILIETDNFIFAGDSNGIKTSLTVSENLRFGVLFLVGKSLKKRWSVSSNKV